MSGFSNISFSPVEYVPCVEALNRFKYLSEFPRKVYIRESVVLSQTELQEYEMALTVPEDANNFYIRIFDPLKIYRFEGQEYLLNGNSRIYTIADLKAKDRDDLIYAPIPVVYVESDQPLTDEQIIRIQSDSNDTTRKHRAIDKIRMIQTFIQRSIDAGIPEKDARKTASKYYGVSSQMLSVAKSFAKIDDSVVLELLDNEQITTDAMTLVLQAAKEHNLTLFYILSQIASGTPIEDMYFKSSMVKRWRERYEAGLQSRLAEVRKESEPKNDGVIRLTEKIESSPETNEPTAIDPVKVAAASASVQSDLTSIEFSPERVRVLGSILATLGTAIDAEESKSLFTELHALVTRYSASKSIPDEMVIKLSETLSRMQ
ncbi:hypothetical protein [Chroococcidiopsis sp.]|uniref:hypothetical protein n=1 Tax=Chroococcidiopsis sp. TaxID=3088168 RepID=UPI003F3954D1